MTNNNGFNRIIFLNITLLDIILTVSLHIIGVVKRLELWKDLHTVIPDSH